MFKGPRRPVYSLKQFAAAYEVPTERVVLWVERGCLLVDNHYERNPDDWRFRDRARLKMEKKYGAPGKVKCLLP